MLISFLVSKYGHKSIVSNALTNDFIYQYLLPIIVLVEGFNNRKKSLTYYKQEIVSFGVLTPLICFAVYSVFLVVSHYLLVNVLGIMKDSKYHILTENYSFGIGGDRYHDEYHRCARSDRSAAFVS